MRHSLSDELAFLNDELLSSLSNQGLGPSLLEEIETQHRNLKELESIKAYVQIIAQALRLRFAFPSLVLCFCFDCSSESSTKQTKDLDPSEPVSEASVSEYKRLHGFVDQVKSQCTSVEDMAGEQSLNLVVFLCKIRDKTWNDVKQALFASVPSYGHVRQLETDWFRTESCSQWLNHWVGQGLLTLLPPPPLSARTSKMPLQTFCGSKICELKLTPLYHQY